MALNKKLINFETKAQFQSANGINKTSIKQSLSDCVNVESIGKCIGNIPWRSIVTIQDTNEIWTHGVYIGGYIDNNTIYLGGKSFNLQTFGNSNYVTLNTVQTITANKTFTGSVEFKGSTTASAIVTDNNSNIVFDTLNNTVYAGDKALLIATLKNGGNIYGALTAIPNNGLYYNNNKLLTSNDAFSDLSSNTEYLISITIGDVTKRLSNSAIKINLGLGQLAYKDSLTYTDVNAAPANHTHAYLPLSGGTITGQLYLTGLDEGSSDVTDNTEILTSYASNNGFADSNAVGKVYRRDAIKVYNYIKGKLDSVYSAIGHTHSYLPLSGGTITGTSICPLIIKSGNSDYSTIRFTTNEGNYITFGYKYVTSDTVPQMFFTDKNAWSKEYQLIHSGNYNNYAPTKTGTGASGTWGINISGNASSATKLTSSAGSATLPIYFSDGKPVACTASSVFSNLSNSGNNISITVAGQSRTLTVGYATSAGNANTASLLALNTNPANTVATAVGSWTPGGNKVYVYRQKWTNSAAGNDTADLAIYLDGNLTANMCIDGYYYTLSGYKVSGKDNNSILLAGGGTKALSEFSVEHSHPYLPLAGGTMTGTIKSTFASNSWINGVTNAIIKGEYTGYGAIISMPVKSGRVSLSSYPSSDNYIYFGYATTAQINAGTNAFNKQMYWDAANNNLHADTFTGALVGNAATSTYASNVGAAGTAGTNYVTSSNVISMYKWYNGITATDAASNTAIDKWNEIVSFLAGITDTSTLSGILAGYAAAGHNHDSAYVKKAGDIITGNISMNNSASITNLPINGGIYWNPYVESASDGSDAASIRVIKGGVAGGTTLVISQQNDANDTIQFATNASASLYHNSNVILTSGNSSISESNNVVAIKINGTTKNVSSSGHTHSYLPLSGGTLTGNLSFSNSGTGFRGINYGTMGDNDQWRIGGAATGSNGGYMEIATANDGNEPIYVRQYTGVFGTVKRTLTLLDANGYSIFPSYINIGGHEKNASSPTYVWGSNSTDSYLRSYQTSKLSVNYAASAGSVAWGNVSGKPSTFTPSSHTHSYLPLAGGSLTGLLSVRNIGNDSAGKYNQGAMQIREYNYGGAQSDTWGNAPRLTWHWNGRVAAQIGLASNGYLYTAPLTGTTFYKLVYESGTWGINITGSAGSVAWGNVTGKPSTFTPSSHTHNYLPLSGGTITGTLGKSSNYIFKPNGGDYRTTGDIHTGAICISFPANVGNTMMSMWIDVYNYSTNTSFSVHVGGYTYSNSTFQHNPFAMVYGASHKVRLTYSGGFKIYIGETNSTWHYPQISVRDIVIGYTGTYSNWYNNWSVSFVTSFPTINSEITRYAITTDNISQQSVKYATSADSVDGQHFNWNNNKNDHTYLWAASSNGQAYLVSRANMSVKYATSAGDSDKLDGKHASDFAPADRGVWPTRSYNISLNNKDQYDFTEDYSGINTSSTYFPDGDGRYILTIYIYIPNSSKPLAIKSSHLTMLHYNGKFMYQELDMAMQWTGTDYKVKKFNMTFKQGYGENFARLMVRAEFEQNGTHPAVLKFRRIM